MDGAVRWKLWDGKLAAIATDAALAVTCRFCNATIGQPCTRYCAHGDPVPSHLCRAEYARELGFRVVADAPLMERMKR